jgi:hypothetical protein
MNEQEGHAAAPDSPSGNDKPLNWFRALQAHEHHAADEKYIAKDKPKKQKYSATKAYWQKFCQAGPAKHIELASSLAIVIFAYLGWQNSRFTSYQTEQLIAASKYGAYASNQNARAANNFAESARSINEGIGDSVVELGKQAELAETAQDISQEASSKALQATIENFNQQQRAWVGVLDYEVSPIKPGSPVDFRIRLLNSGNTPALHFMVNAHGWFSNNYANRESTEIDSQQKEWGPRGDSVIPPKAVHIVRNEYASLEKVSDKNFRGFLDGTLTYYIAGSAKYIDPTQGPQTITFCIDYSVPGINITVPPSARLCEHGNTMSYEKNKH